jgi:hypothetical protein
MGENRDKKNSIGKTKDQYGLRLVQADVTLRSESGQSIHDAKARIDSKTVRTYLPPKGAAESAAKILAEMGFRIIAMGKITINIAAPLEEFQKIFEIKLTPKRFFPYAVPPAQRVPDEKGCGIFFEYKGGKELPVPEKLAELVDSIHLATPAIFCQSPDPPSPGYFHLKVPGDVARLVDAVQCHNHGFDGTGVKLAMPDQGTFDHPYYTSRGYNITLDESAYDETADNGSHGTAIAANVLAVAPGVEFIGIRNGKKVSSATAAFQQAVSHNPDVISISWGTETDVADLRAAVALAIADGITICCACGNGGTLVFPSSMQELISVGGTYADANDNLQASSYASSGILAGVDPGRRMPDLTGFVGQEPKGIYITLPCHPSSAEDTSFGGGTFPNGDETAADDGWLVASGTSSATPQVAAAACLLIQSDNSFRDNPAAIKQRLMETALDVTAGTSANGEAAAAGTDNATGSGVVDAFIAVNRVDVWMRDNTNDRGLVPCKGAHWISPDIKVTASALANPDADFDAAAHIDRPVYGTEYYVYIKARNRGVDPAANVTVGFYYADPSTFAVFPNDWRDGQSGVPTEGSISVGGAATNLFPLASVPAKSARVAGPFHWHPPEPTSATQVETDAGGKKRGHFCLLARIDCAADQITWTGGSQATVWLDNNIGMKNLWVVEPGMTWPLMVGRIPWAKKNWLTVSVSDLPRGCQLVVQAPEKAFDPADLRRSKVSYKNISGGLLEFNLQRRISFRLGLTRADSAPLRFSLKAKKGSKLLRPFSVKGMHTVEIAHYGDGIQAGGASFILKAR